MTALDWLAQSGPQGLLTGHAMTFAVIVEAEFQGRDDRGRLLHHTRGGPPAGSLGSSTCWPNGSCGRRACCRSEVSGAARTVITSLGREDLSREDR